MDILKKVILKNEEILLTRLIFHYPIQCLSSPSPLKKKKAKFDKTEFQDPFNPFII